MSMLKNLVGPKHKRAFWIIDAVLILVSFLPLPFIVEVVRQLTSGFGALLNCIAILLYAAYLVFSVVVCTAVLTIFYKAFQMLGFIGNGEIEDK